MKKFHYYLWKQLNNEFKGQLALAIQIFKGEYHTKIHTAINFKSVRYG